mgnify:CR=1 FL=1
MIKDYILQLPYFKQGDDLYFAKQSTDNDADAFVAHAELMQETANILKTMASKSKEHNLKIVDCDTHFISVSVDQEIGDILVKDGLLCNHNDEDFSGDDGEFLLNELENDNNESEYKKLINAYDDKLAQIVADKIVDKLENGELNFDL